MKKCLFSFKRMSKTNKWFSEKFYIFDLLQQHYFYFQKVDCIRLFPSYYNFSSKANKTNLSY